MGRLRTYLFATVLFTVAFLFSTLVLGSGADAGVQWCESDPLVLVNGAIVDVTTATGKWAEQHRGEVAKWLAAVTGVPLDIQTVAADRANFVVGPVTDDIVTTQQGVADRFYKLGLIPKPIVVRDIVWRNPAA